MNQHIFRFCVTFCFPSQSCQEMPKKTVVPFYSIGLCLGLHQHRFWHKLVISPPIVSTDNAICNMLYLFPQFHSCFCSPGANLTIDEPAPISINSNPDPTIVFFDPIYVCISSNSTTSISSVFLNSSSFSPKDFIQLKTATWLTFKYLPIDRNPSPSRYKTSASRFNLLGLPTCSTVKWCLHSLQKYLCRDLIIPSLRKSRLLHFGQLSILIDLKLIITQRYKTILN